MPVHQFAAMYNELFLDIYRYVFFRIPHQQDAEDVVSHIFIEALRTVEKFNEEKGTIRQWIFGIARFSVIDYWKWQKRHASFDIDAIENILTHANWPAADESYDAQLLFDQVMDSLPANVRALFALRYLDGLTYQEIAEIVDKKPDAVRKLFSLTHQKLRKQFRDAFPEWETSKSV